MDFIVRDRPDLAQQDFDVPDLIATWDQAMSDLIAAADEAGPQGWGLPSPCPGWSVGDLVAHVTGIERFLLGRTDPPHAPDYDALPHAQAGLSKYIEIPVDLRRSWDRDVVLAEARATLADRKAALLAAADDPDDEVLGPFGKPMALSGVLRIRTFDIWIHEQDIRVATDRPGDLGTAPAWITAGQLAAALPIVWVKRAGAPEGAVIEVTVTGPGVTLHEHIAHVPGGRGEYVAPVPLPDVRVELSWPDLVALAAGRIPAESGLGRVKIQGDSALGQAFVANLAVTP